MMTSRTYFGAGKQFCLSVPDRGALDAVVSEATARASCNTLIAICGLLSPPSGDALPHGALRETEVLSTIQATHR